MTAFDEDAINLRHLLSQYLRLPTTEYRDGTMEFTPPLTAEEQATFATLQKMASIQTSWTPALYDQVRPQLQVLRDLRQLGRNAFMQLAANDRDRMIYDALVAQTIIDLALLRDT
jgi:hypothetical protein